MEQDQNIELHLNTRVTNDLMDQWQAENIYGVILACGGEPIKPRRVPGIEKGVLWKDVLAGNVNIENKNVAVIGGGMTGLETALYLAERGNKITLIEMLPLIGNNIFVFNRHCDQAHLEEQGAVIKINTEMLEIRDGSILVQPAKNVKYTGVSLKGASNITGVGETVAEETQKGPYEIPVDCTVISLGIRTNLEMLDELNRRFARVAHIGECNKQGNVGDATSEGFLTAKNF